MLSSSKVSEHVFFWYTKIFDASQAIVKLIEEVLLLRRTLLFTGFWSMFPSISTVLVNHFVCICFRASH